MSPPPEPSDQPGILIFAEGIGQAVEVSRMMRSESRRAPKVIAIDPEAAYEFDHQGIPYAVPDEYCSEAQLNELGIGNFEKVERLCRYADQWLSSRCDCIRAFGLTPAWYNFFALKRLFDLMSTNLLLLDAVLQKEQPGEVLYFADDRGGAFDQNLFFVNSVYPDLIPLACRRLGLRWRELPKPDVSADDARWRAPARRPGQWRQSMNVVRTVAGSSTEFVKACWNRLRTPNGPVILFDDLVAEDIRLVASQLIKDTRWRLATWRPGRGVALQIAPPAMWRLNHTVERDPLVERLPGEAERRWEELSRDDAFAAQLAWDGVRFGPVLESRLRYVFTTLLIETVQRYVAARRLIERLRPALVLFSQIVVPRQHALAAAARQARVPIVGYQHGALGERFAPILYYTDCREPDYLLTYGEGVSAFIKQTFQKAALPIAVGSPRLDRLSRRRTNNRDVRCRKWGLDPRRRIVAYCPTLVYGRKAYVSYCYPRSDQDYFRVQARIVQVFNEFPSVQLIVKEHPETSDTFPLRRFVRDQGITNCVFTGSAGMRMRLRY